VPHCIIDTNWWKTFVHNRLAVAEGEPTELRLFGDRAVYHQMLADHLRSEQRIIVEARGRKVDEWKLPPAKPDNHWFDCIVGAAVAASILGCAIGSASNVKTTVMSARPTLRQLRGH
jgi:phage terminase large subunit GpA-like protein